MNIFIKILLFSCVFASINIQKCHGEDLLFKAICTEQEMILNNDNELEDRVDAEQDDEQRRRKALYKKILYVLSGATVVACAIGLYWYMKRVPEPVQHPVQSNPVNHQQGNPFDRINVPPIQENENFNVGVRFYGPGYGMQQQQEAENILMQQLRIHGNFNQAVRYLVAHYPLDPAVHIDVACRERGGLWQVDGIAHP